MRLKSLYFALGLIWALFAAQPLLAAQYIPDSSIGPNITRNVNIVPTGETNAVCIGNTPGPTFSTTLCATLDLTGKVVYYKPPEVTVANLPANRGIVIVTDSTSATACGPGGGNNKVPCWWNGSSWSALSGGGGGTGDVTDVFGTGGGTGANEICVTNPGGPQPTLALCQTVAILSKTFQVGRIDLAGIISPPALAAQTEDWNPANLATASTIRITTTGPQNIGGLQGGSAGRILTLANVGNSPVTLLDQATGSIVSNRFALGSNVTIAPNQTVLTQYDATSSRWRLVGGIGATDNFCDTAGSAVNVYACNLSPSITSYVTGRHYFFKANAANTGAANIAFNGLAAAGIKKAVGGVTTDLLANDIRQNQIVELAYDGANMQMLSMLGNSPTGISGLTPTVMPRATSPTQIGDSGIIDDGTTISFNPNRAIVFGGTPCTTNCLTEDRSLITGLQTYTYPNHTGTLGVFPNARKNIQVELFPAGTNVASGNGAAYFRVPSSLNGMSLVSIASNVITAGTTGLNSVQITRCPAAATLNICSGVNVSMLTTVVSIDSQENSSSNAATAAVINPSNASVSTGQILRFDVTAVSTTPAQGLIVSLEFELP